MQPLSSTSFSGSSSSLPAAADSTQLNCIAERLIFQLQNSLLIYNRKFQAVMINLAGELEFDNCYMTAMKIKCICAIAKLVAPEEVPLPTEYVIPLAAIMASLNKKKVQRLNLGAIIASLYMSHAQLDEFIHRCGVHISHLNLTKSSFPLELMHLCPNLTHFTLNGCFNEGFYNYRRQIEAVSYFPFLSTLTLAANGLDADGIEWVTKGLLENSRLRYLDLEENLLKEEEVPALNDLLKKCPELCYLNLSSNLLGNQGAERIVKDLTFPPSIQMILMRENEFEIEDGVSIGVLNIARAVGKLPNLWCLDLSYNELLLKDLPLFASLLSDAPKLLVLKLTITRNETDLMSLPKELMKLKTLRQITLLFDHLGQDELETLPRLLVSKLPHLQVVVDLAEC